MYIHNGSHLCCPVLLASQKSGDQTFNQVPLDEGEKHPDEDSYRFTFCK
jgi:hypothetical protein